MASDRFLVAAGREAYYGGLPGTGTGPAADRLVYVLLDVPSEPWETIITRDTLSAVLANSSECTATGYSRITTTLPMQVNRNDTLNRVNLFFAPDPAWDSVGAGPAITFLVVAYMDSSTTADTAIVPLFLCEPQESWTPDGRSIRIFDTSSGVIQL